MPSNCAKAEKEMKMEQGQIVVSTIEGISYNVNAVAKFHKLCGTTGKMIVIPVNGWKDGITAPMIVTAQYWRKLGE